jgi:fibronectin type III domain protein
MRMSSSIHDRLRRYAATGAIVVATACGTTPSGPTAVPPAVTPLASSPASGRVADFARCLGGGGGDASCFTSGVLASAANGPSAAITSPPLSLSAAVNGNVVVLSWSPPASGGPVISYLIDAGTVPGVTNLITFNTGSAATSLTVPGVPNGIYYVRVRAVDGSGASQPSNEVIVVVGASGACAGPPTNLTVTSQSAGAISLGWLAPATGSPTSYVILAGSAPGLSNLANFDTGNPSTSFSTGGVPAGSYYVRLLSRSNCGLSAASNEVLVFVVGFTGDVQVSVSWDAPSDVDLHVVEPGGNELYYGNPSSPTGGQLDVDSNAACAIDGRQIENIRWGGQAPAGSYTVRVDYWDACNVARTNYLVTVKNGPSTQTFPGVFTGPGDQGGGGSGVFITSFVHAASAVLPARMTEMFRAPALFTASPAKLKPRGGTR